MKANDIDDDLTHIIIHKISACTEELRCSKCDMPWLWSGEKFLFKYCPNCGAKFDRTKDEYKPNK